MSTTELPRQRTIKVVRQLSAREIYLYVLFVVATAVFVISVFASTTVVWGTLAAGVAGFLLAKVVPTSSPM